MHFTTGYSSDRFYDGGGYVISQIKLDQLGRIQTRQEGIVFVYNYREGYEVIVPTAELIKTYGGALLGDLYNYAQSPTQDPIERMVKDRMKDIFEGSLRRQWIMKIL